jgi:ankyrin repeat protein
MDINVLDSFKQTPLHIALMIESCEIVNRIFILKHSLLLKIDSESNNELHKWVNHSCESCLLNLKEIITDRSYIIRKNYLGNNALHQAVIENNFNSFKLLIENFNFDLTEQGENDSTLLELCCLYNTNLVNIFIYNNKENI